MNCKILLKKDDLNYKSKRGKTYNFSKYVLPIVFLRGIHDGHSSIEGAHHKQSNFANELKSFDKSTKTLECEREQALEQADKGEKKSKIKLHKEFINAIDTDEKYINNEIFWKYFKYQSPSFLAKDLFKVKNIHCSQLKILSPKQILQSLLITLAHVKTDNTSDY